MSATNTNTDNANVRFSSGNVFADLGLPEPQEELTKATLAMQISRIVTCREWSQSQAARAMGIDQPKVSALVRGRLTDFSTERLLIFLTLLGQDVEIVVKPKPELQPKAKMWVSLHNDSMTHAAK